MKRNHKIHYGMVGGGKDAFIGDVHRIVARMDDRFELVAGAFSSSAQKSIESAAELYISTERAYETFEAMADKESVRSDGIEAVSIVTPNNLHAAAAKAFLEKGIHVICDKPLTATLDEALELEKIAKSSSAMFFLTHNYSGYPMIRQARSILMSGVLGKIRVIQVEYAQDWLATDLESTGHKQAGWRTDPSKSGGGAIGDIGSHAFHLASYVSGLRALQLTAQLTSFVPGRKVDDDAQILLRFEGGAKGMLWASQVATGNRNTLKLRIFGETGGLEWEQENPERLIYTKLGEPQQVIYRGYSGATEVAAKASRTPGGHPEGYLEAFANLYRDAADAIIKSREGKIPHPKEIPGIEDGLLGMKFIDACQKSSSQNSVWVSLA